MKGFKGQELMHNDDFRSISPNEFIEEGNLVWIERFKDAYYNIEIEGPFVIEEGWGPVWFGPKNMNKPRPKGFVKLVSTVNGEVRHVTHGHFLSETFYIMNEEKLCTDVGTK